MTTIQTLVEMGKKYEDKNTGLIGVAVAVTKWQYGCVRIGLQPKAKEDGTVPDAVWIDEAGLKGVEPVKAFTGGPTPAPRRNPDPRR